MLNLTRTFHDRTDDHPALGEMAGLWGAAQRFLYREFIKGRKWTGDLAVSHYADFGLGAKQWEHCWRDLMGKVSSQVECDLLETKKLERRVEAKEKRVAKTDKSIEKSRKFLAAQLLLKSKAEAAGLAGRRLPKKQFDAVAHGQALKEIAKAEFSLHQHKRKLESLKYDLEWSKRPRQLCFGGRKLFNAQHHLKDNGYRDHSAWKVDWTASRNSQFFVEGDARFESGNGYVRVHPKFDGTFDIEVRIPESLKHLAETRQKMLTGDGMLHSIWLRGLRFTHGKAQIYHALRRGLPISWRFLRDGNTWRVFAMIGLAYVEQKKQAGGRWSMGAIGVDLNVGHVSATLVDRFGNPVEMWKIPFDCYGKTEAQREDAVRKTAHAVMELAKKFGVPIVSETLDFTQKKEALRDTAGPWRARMLTSFAYSAFDRALESVCIRHSIHLRRVNPAFTSVIGDLSYARRYGLSVHAAAAAVIARRAMNLSECVPARTDLIRPKRADQVTLPRPVRNEGSPRTGKARAGHVWSAWGRIAKQRRAALAGPAAPDGRTVRPPGYVATVQKSERRPGVVDGLALPWVDGGAIPPERRSGSA